MGESMGIHLDPPTLVLGPSSKYVYSPNRLVLVLGLVQFLLTFIHLYLAAQVLSGGLEEESL